MFTLLCLVSSGVSTNRRTLSLSRSFSFLCLSAIFALFGAISSGAQGLSVSITSPSSGAIFTEAANIAIDATASSSTGTVARVDFFNGRALVGQDTSSPYTATWLAVPIGIYQLQAVAVDTTGVRATSAPVIVIVSLSQNVENQTFIPLGSNWKYLDDGSDQGTGWSTRTFNDSGWASGIAPLGYCGSSCSYSITTTVGYGSDANNKYVTTYFRRPFVVDDPSRIQSLTLRVLRDDGAVVHINGVEAARVYMPEGAITYTTLSAQPAGNWPTPDVATVSSSALLGLVPGTNIVAVEIHQGGFTSSDIVMDLELTGSVSAPVVQPPLVNLIDPAEGAVVSPPGNFQLNALAADLDGSVTNVEFYANGAKIGQDTSSPYGFNWTGVPLGNYSLLAVASDNSGQRSTSSVVNVSVSSYVPPPLSVSITSPVSGASFTEPATILVEATAVSSNDAVARVEFYSGQTLLGQDLLDPYSITWPNVFAGIYQLQAVAIDTTGLRATSAPVVVIVGRSQVAQDKTLIAWGGTWKYLDNGTDQGTAWRGRTFNDSSWASGPAPLGYGSAYTIATRVSYGPDSGNKYPTTYFRTPFVVEDPSRIAAMNLQLLRDDGAVVYINGEEAFRVFMPEGDITYDTWASGASDFSPVSAAVPSSVLQALVAGTNIVAVEVHQGNPTSSDIVLNFELIGSVTALTDQPPLVNLVNPLEGTLVASPGSFQLNALAADVDGSITTVEFFSNGAKIGQDTTSPYTWNWSSVAAGDYSLLAIATDNIGQRSTSSVVHVSVSGNVAPPTVIAQSPVSGTVTNLDAISVTFSKDVQGINAADFLVNGVPATNVTGSGPSYTFSFPQPAYGSVSISWAAGHGITDLFSPPHAFDENGTGATWQYNFIDLTPPVIASVQPIPGLTVPALNSITIQFKEPVTGVNASDLLIGGTPASTVMGSGAGPYVFNFIPLSPGAVTVSWAAGHGIIDAAGNAFSSGPWSYIVDPNAQGVLISEIMYHPSSENILEEYIELYNPGNTVANLTDWRFSGGVQFTFPFLTLAPNSYVVVCADLATFTAKYPTVTNVVGNWQGFLNNGGENIRLDDAAGRRVATLRYADEGDWAIRRRGPPGTHRGWIWYAEHDGLGKSLELINPAMPQEYGQNWAASTPAEGTPGQPNSWLTNDIAPLILDVRHFPIIPKSTESVQVTARIIDESGPSVTVTLRHRVDSTTTNSWTVVSMTDDGSNGDAVAGDGLYTATIAPRANNAVIEFFVRATDLDGRVRNWPAPAIPATDGGGPSGQIVNALYQVDDLVYNPTNNQPQYRLIMTETERAELAGIPCNSSSDGQMNGTFISTDTSGVELQYLCGFRNRGHGSRCPASGNPPNYHVAFRSDDQWKGVTAINLNSQNARYQHLGSVLARKAGADGARIIAVRVRVNNADRTPPYGSYAAVEVVNGDWGSSHYPLDPNGNIYKVIRDISPPDFTYRGETPATYMNTYFKENNIPENYWGDLIDMLRVAGINNTTLFTTENVRQVIDVEQWMTHLAVMNIFGNGETGLNMGYNDDYLMYFGVQDRRARLLYWDIDSILGSSGENAGSLGATSGIYTSTAANGSGQAFSRFLNHPDFNPIYLRTLKRLLETTFAQSNFNATVDQTLGGYVAVSVLNNIKSWMDTRRNYLLGTVLVDVPAESNAPVAVISGAPRSPTSRRIASLTVGGTDVVAYRYSLNGAAYSAETSIASPISLSSLPEGTNRITVIGKNSLEAWQDISMATEAVWVVDATWPAVRLNEVLARNATAYNHSGKFPDVIELFNEGSSTVDLSGLRLTDDPSNPNKFSFPSPSSLGAGQYLILYADDPDGTAGYHLGFNLSGEGEGVYLYDTVARGGALLDSVTFGFQIEDFSIGRIGGGGKWVLCVPTPGSANTTQPLGDPTSLRINEWLASGANPYPYDFIELYNPNSLPVDLSDLYFTDHPIGAPGLSPIGDLSFIAGNNFATFIADGEPQLGPGHLDFKLSMDQGEIALMSAQRKVLDVVIYGPQQTDVSSGRCPDGSLSIKPLVIPTPGAPNACPPAPPEPVTVPLVPFANVWSYDESGTDLGTAWKEPGYNDNSWPTGAALLADETAALPEPIRTGLTVGAAKPTFYFRTTFTLPAGLNTSSLSLTHVIDDGVILYLNGSEIYRYNMPEGTITFADYSGPAIGDATLQGPFSLPATQLQAGENVLAAEVHQSTAASGDIVFGLKLDAIIVTNSPALAGLLINEVLANNANLEEADGSKPDWVEIYNPSANAVDLGDMSLTDDTLEPRRWVFPTGSIITAQGFFTVRCNPDLPASSTNTGFGLKASGGAVFLMNRLVDGGIPASALSYGLQAADWSIGRVPDGSTNWVLTTPNFGGANFAATLGDPALLKVNEWMAAPSSGADWFEIYNPNLQPVDISRFWLSDDLAGRQVTQLPALSFIGVGAYGFQLFIADSDTLAGPDHVGFALKASGEALVISTPAGAIIDGVRFGIQATDVSQGRLTDGKTNVVSFPQTPTPGKPNFLPVTSVFINEIFTHSDPPFEDAVEIYNPGIDEVDISNWYLSDSQNDLLKYRIPPNTFVPAHGYLVFYEYQFNSDAAFNPFSFSSAKGDEVYLTEATPGGVITGYRAFAEFGAAENGVSFGRFQTSSGTDYTAMSSRTFGQDNPPTVEQFRLGTGLANSYPKVGPVVLNEIMYYPPGTNDALEYVELHNLLGVEQPLYDPAHPENTWRVRKGIDFDFPTGVSIPAGGYVVLVRFDPATDPASLAAFQAAYGNNMVLYGPYQGKLNNEGEAIELQKPDAPETVPGPDFGHVPRIVADRVVYSYTAPWPASPYGTGHSLMKTMPSLYGNEPLNWMAGSPTPGAPNGGTTITNTPPVLAAIGNKTVPENSILTFSATASDTETPQALTYSLDPGAPSGASITSAGLFTWTPTENQGPQEYSITIRVSDGGTPVLTDLETITITVTEVNDAPVLVPIGNKIIDEGTLVTFTATASDPDIPANTLTYSLDNGAPPDASIDPATGIFTWQTTEAHGGNIFTITVRVTDNGTLARSDSETLTITVNEVNSAPVLSPITDKTVNEEAPISFTAIATDSDLPAQTLTFDLVGVVPNGAGITANGLFTWTPDESQSGTNYLTIRVRDNGVPPAEDTQVVRIVVNEVNTPPVLAHISDKTANEGVLLTFTATATDSDLPPQTLTFDLTGTVPSGASITTDGVFSWTPKKVQNGTTNLITIRVRDNAVPPGETSQTFTVIVSQVNTAPVLTYITDKTVNEGTLLTFTATATDEDVPTQTLTFDLTGTVPAGASITSDGVFTWTPAEDQDGTSFVVIRVRDSWSPAAEDTQVVTIIVNEVNTAPTLAAITNRNVIAGELLTLTATATDSDLPAQTLTFHLTSDAPPGASITADGVFTWRPDLAQSPSTNQISVYVTDNGTPSLSATQTFTVVVIEPARGDFKITSIDRLGNIAWTNASPAGFVSIITAPTISGPWTTRTNIPSTNLVGSARLPVTGTNTFIRLSTQNGASPAPLTH